jgi:predicted DNA-binding protein (MmcQ/YjbR family)
VEFNRFIDFCLQKPFVSETFPFDDKTLVMKVGGKMFALADVDNFTSINLKCDPGKAIELREQYAGISPGYHMNKKHWITVNVNEDVPDSLLQELISASYTLVYDSLPKKLKYELEMG